MTALKKPKLACALQYDRNSDRAPRVVAKGERLTAERILRIAAENGVPVYEDPALAKVLMSLDLGAEIPPELYKAFAHVLAFVYELNDKSRTSQITHFK